MRLVKGHSGSAHFTAHFCQEPVWSSPHNVAPMLKGMLWRRPQSVGSHPNAWRVLADLVHKPHPHAEHSHDASDR